MKKVPRPIRKIQIDFTDDAITASAGSLFIAGTARRLGLPALLESALRLKKRTRGASDAAKLLSLVYRIAQRDGALCDVDRLAVDGARREALHLSSVPDSRRLGEYLCRFDAASVAALQGVVRALSRAVAGAVINHELKTKGYVPLFIDGTVIEMSGSYGEGVAKGYDGQPQLWLHNAFIGGLWVSHRFNGGGTGRSGWRFRATATILVSRTDLPLKEIVARHRGKCGQENAMKGPLIDLDLHHPPCLKLDANRAFYAVEKVIRHAGKTMLRLTTEVIRALFDGSRRKISLPAPA